MEMESKSRKAIPMERRPAAPRILKDYLRDDLSSCSSSGFRSLPRRSCYNNTTTSIRCLIQNDHHLAVMMNNKPIHHHNKKSSKKSASSSTANSALQKASQVVMNVVRHFHYFSSSAKQGIFARNLSRRLKRSFTKKCRSNREKCDHSEIAQVHAVKVRDIVRWRSFRDLIEANDQQIKVVRGDKDCLISESIASPIDPTITNTTTTTTTTTTSTTANHSWSDSDFTVSEYFNSSCPSSDYSIESKKELTEKRTANSSVNEVGEQGSISIDKGECRIEKDQLSPVSVHDFPSEEDEETPSSFMSSMDKMERTKRKLMTKIRRFESLCQLEPVDLKKRIALFDLDDDSTSECCSNSFSINDGEAGEEIIAEEEKYEDEYVKKEKAQYLLQVLLMQNRSEHGYKASSHEPLLLNFFLESLIEREQAKKASKEGNESDEEIMLRKAKEWMSGEYKSLDFGIEESREVHIIEMEKGLRWNQFEEERGEAR
ncbi:hypothetical protein Sjap_020700 [Stephania japonica]|uniref:Uncharacterized protein n=1 Tax=Stephania japonica TaxID=461633 RepID=A0AAP0F168_9MAGN